jgi:hypothetical protein
MSQATVPYSESAALKCVLMAVIGVQASLLGEGRAQRFLEQARKTALEAARTSTYTSDATLDTDTIREETIRSVNGFFDSIHVAF